ncbi:hypothetical protein F2P81_025872 [Scophthalmus maximus]|uniref:Ig-like domain-containing protein n=1 Tax=Scophthalmus maximus TaxID=52904 RepID=A0A6A4RNM2_SCOMX|nr:hypothetical protein F2P81_025872 [Scophthalmus maximus]
MATSAALVHQSSSTWKIRRKREQMAKGPVGQRRKVTSLEEEEKEKGEIMGSFEEGERAQSVSQGEGAVVAAPRIRSFPQPQVTWFRDGRKIPPSSRIHEPPGTIWSGPRNQTRSHRR